MKRTDAKAGLRPKLIALSVAACFTLSASRAFANPNGPTVVSGNASFSGLGTSSLTIANSANAIINWNGFSIGINELTKFLQPSVASAVLNRVTGTDVSNILGALQSNGHVFLINPNGIVFGASARIDVAGLIASSLNLSDQDFLNGRLRFTEVPGAGGVTNAGIIETPAGGRVYLVAPDVQNSGIIHSPQGEIVLAAGKSVELMSESSPYVTVRVNAGTEQAVNLGSLMAESGRIGMFAGLVRHAGVATASAAVVGDGGQIRFVATKDLTVEAGSRVAASGASGGKVLLQAEGGTNLVAGTVEAIGTSGRGGDVQALGVRVGVIGNGVIDASGETGGGTVLVGGDAHGANPGVQNAQRTLIGPDGVIRADARNTGDGGRVIVWADGDTQFRGAISVRGGAQAGNGGFVETSGKQNLNIEGGRVDARAANGEWGTWLLDPNNVIIEPNSYYGVTEPSYYVDQFGDVPMFGEPARIRRDTIESAFGSVGQVKIQATNDVTLNDDLTLLYYGTPGTFEIRAGHDINLGSHGISTNGHHVVLSAADSFYGGGPMLNTSATSGSITGSATIATDLSGASGGNIALSGWGVQVGNLRTNGGTVTVTSLAGGIQAGDVDTRSAASSSNGNVTVAATGSGNVTLGNVLTRTTENSYYGTPSAGGVDISTQEGTISVVSIDTSGRDASSPGQNYGADGGEVTIVRSGTTTPSGFAVSIGSIVGKGGNARPGFGTDGGWGGFVTIAGDSSGSTPIVGAVSVPGGINTSGGAGGSYQWGTAGEGGDGGWVAVRATGQVALGPVIAVGGAGGHGLDGGESFADGGSGGWGGGVMISGGQLLLAGVSAAGGKGGTGATFGIDGDVGESGPILLSGSDSVTITADDLDLSNGFVSAGTYFAWLTASGGSMSLGAGGQLDDTELANISAPLLRLGTQSGNITLTGALNLGSMGFGTLSLFTNGFITQNSGAPLMVASLNAVGASGVGLGEANSVANLQAFSAGNVIFNNSGALNLALVDAGNPTAGVLAGGVAQLKVAGNIGSTIAGTYSVQGSTVFLDALGGAIGSAAAPLEVHTSNLAAAADNGLYINTNQFSPAPVTVSSLANFESGNLALNAWGGATTTTTIHNGGGDVEIRTHSPLNIGAGVDAAGNILLATSGASPNDMQLNGTFKYGPGGTFEVNVGLPGLLLKGSSFSGLITKQNGGAGSVLDNPVVNNVISSTINETNNAVLIEDAGTTTTSAGDPDEQDKKDKAKKGAPSCA